MGRAWFAASGFTGLSGRKARCATGLSWASFSTRRPRHSRSLLAERRRSSGPLADGAKIGFVRPDEPRPSHAKDRSERQPFGCLFFGHPTGRAEADIGKGPRQRSQGGDPSGAFGWEELEVVKAEVEPAHDVACG